MKGSPPLRFLAILLGGWAAMRTALVAPLWPTPPADSVAPAPLAHSRGRAVPRHREAAAPLHPRLPASRDRGRAPWAAAIRPPSRSAALRPAAPTSGREALETARMPASTPAAPNYIPTPRPEAARDSARRWSLSAWSFARRGDSAPLAAGGLLGGSQAGARLAYRLNRDQARPIALSLRLSSPLRSPAGAEAAFGLDWKPSGRLPLRFLAERRQAFGRKGRSGFALTIYGGVSDAPLGAFRIDAYAQAGMVGARSRDPFGDGSLRLSLPLGDRVRLGAGAWASAQPGLARLDLGPQAAVRLPLGGRTVTLAADWRVRAAGNARPGSGPALTVATDF